MQELPVVIVKHCQFMHRHTDGPIFYCIYLGKRIFWKANGMCGSVCLYTLNVCSEF